jgi:hypothetical protein
VRNGDGTLGRIVTDDQLYQEAVDAVHGIEDAGPISVLATLIMSLS